VRAERDAARVVLAVADHIRSIDAVCAIGEGVVGVILPEAGIDDAILVAQALHPALAGARAAIGIAVCPDDGVEADALVTGAREAATNAAAGATVVVRDAVSEIDVGKHRVVVADPAMIRIYELARRLARSNLPILVQGETGSGKELAAAAVHAWSPRVAGPFLSINCAAIPETLAESELFGHARGSFSGAHADKIGQLEAASGGTLFLDEIGELPLALQAKLLRVLETGELTRVGEVSPRTTDLRLVAATHRDLDAEVEAGNFRRDLFFRLGSARLTLPPLRDRPRDLGALARRMLAEAVAGAGRARLDISVDAMHTLHQHSWPGNVRELKNAIEYATTAAPDDAHEIELWHLPELIAAFGRARASDRGFAVASTGEQPVVAVGGPSPSPPPSGFRPIADEVRELERARMVAALRATGGVQNKAAELIEMPQRTFATKLKRYAIVAADWGGS
jgi:DNA-binding NtrC family response regulator